MKIVLDLQGCQTGARSEAGDASLALAEALARVGGAHEFLFLLDHAGLAVSTGLLRHIERFASLADVVLFAHPRPERSDEDEVARRRIADLLRIDRIETLSPDVYHVCAPRPAMTALPGAPVLNSASLIGGEAWSPDLVGRLAVALARDETDVRRLHPDAIAVVADGVGAREAARWDETARALLDAWERASPEGRPDRPANSRPPRIAMFTPLPPARSGIADYGAELLGLLRRFAEIEVFVSDDDGLALAPEGVRVSNHAAFEARTTGFDAIVYQLGNSPFHHYMLPYAARHPGIVVIHDAYLGHLSHDPANPAALVRQAIRDHGGEARALVDGAASLAEGALALVDRLTCAGTHVHRSHGVIVHSAFARDLLVATSRPAVAPQIRVVPQYRAPPAEDRPDRAEARRRLGLPGDALLIGAFGHVAATKGSLELIAAFDRAKSRMSGEAILVFVGEPEGAPDATTPYGRRVLAAIDGRPDVVVTGFVSPDAYADHLRAVDMGVQLRTLTRGETSRALLDLMWSGTPLVYNRLGAAAELPDDVALALDAVDVDAVTDAIVRLASDPKLRDTLADAALAHMRATRGGDRIAREFLGTVLDMTARARACGPEAVAAALAEPLSGLADPGEGIAGVARAYVVQERSEDLPRLLVDLTPGDRSTVPGPVRDMARALFRTPGRRLRPQAIAFVDGVAILADDLARACGVLLPAGEPDVARGPLTPRPFDKLLLASPRADVSGIARAVHGMAGEVHGLVDEAALREVGEGSWLDRLVREADGLICATSRAAETLAERLRSGCLPGRDGLRTTRLADPPGSPAGAREIVAFVTGRGDDR